jgi:hypothetical protein
MKTLFKRDGTCDELQRMCVVAYYIHVKLKFIIGVGFIPRVENIHVTFVFRQIQGGYEEF